MKVYPQTTNDEELIKRLIQTIKENLGLQDGDSTDDWES